MALESRARNFTNNITEGMTNKHYSQIYDILKVAVLYVLYNEVMNIIFNVHF